MLIQIHLGNQVDPEGGRTLGNEDWVEYGSMSVAEACQLYTVKEVASSRFSLLMKQAKSRRIKNLKSGLFGKSSQGWSRVEWCWVRGCTGLRR